MVLLRHQTILSTIKNEQLRMQAIIVQTNQRSRTAQLPPVICIHYHRFIEHSFTSARHEAHTHRACRLRQFGHGRAKASGRPGP